MTGERFTFFQGGPFSLWFPSKFVVDGVRYNTVEQYMMAHKALLFDDQESFEKILSTHNTRKQKHFGRTVKGFNKDEWKKIARGVVFIGNYNKFKQNPDFKKLLLNTAGTTIVEASPYDKIWGIGLDEKHPDRFNRRKWKGRNWLGQVLTEVRDTLIKEDNKQKNL